MNASVGCGRRRWVCAGAVAVALTVVSLSHAADAACGDGTIDSEAACPGDCDGNGKVTVDECLREIGIALGSLGIDACPAGDVNSDGGITVDEVIACVNFALNGCPGSGTDDPAHECDDGGRCVGGSDAGEFCTSEAECDPARGACFGGINDLRACSRDGDCEGGSCRRCRPYGGDGCAANCTSESDMPFNLVPGVLDSSHLSVEEGTSGGTFRGRIVQVPITLTGTLALTTGKTLGDVATAVLPVAAFGVDRFGGASIFCACMRGIEAKTCGGTLLEPTGEPSTDCTPGLPDAEECPADKACAAVHGPGNTGSGFIGCGTPGVDVALRHDCNGEPGGVPFDPVLTVAPSAESAAPGDGSGFLWVTTTFGQVLGSCTGSSDVYGPDGEYCTDDDPVAGRGLPTSIAFTTNSSNATVLNPIDHEGDFFGPFETSGAPFRCGAGGTIGVSGADLAGAFTRCDVPILTDSVVSLNLVAE